MKNTILLATLICLLMVNRGASQWNERESPVIKDVFPVEPFFVGQRLTAYWQIQYPCVATKGIPKPKTYWKRFENGKFKGDIEARTGDGDWLLNGTRLALKHINEEESYQCVASNKYGVALSNKISIMKAVAVEFYLDQKKTPHVITKKVGETLVMECKPLRKGKPPGRYFWQIGNIPIKNDRVFTNEAGSLVFSYLLASDAETYICRNYNPNKVTTTGGGWTKLTVNPGTGATLPDGLPIELLYSTPDNTVAMYGKEFTMQCIFGGKPIPEVEWGGDVKLDKPSGHTLKIPHVTEEHKGCYTCNGWNKFERSAVNRICIDVKGPPIWVQKPAPVVIVAEDSDVQFHCKARALKGESQLEWARWMRNGNDLGLGRGALQRNRLSLSMDGTILTFTDVKKNTDVCNFQCSFNNSYGEIFADASFNVILKTEILKAPESKMITRGDVVAFHIEARVDRLVEKKTKYTWYLNGNEIETFDISDIKILMPNRTLIVNTSQMDEDRFNTFLGNYSIVIDNDVKSVVRSALLTEEPKAGGTTMDSAFLDAKWIALIVALVLFFIIFILLLCILFNRHGGDDYSVDKKERKAGHNPEKELADSGFHDLPRTDDDPGLQKPDNLSISSTGKSIASDTDSMGEYSEIDAGSRFNEDGSFIGAYQSHESKGNATNV